MRKSLQHPEPTLLTETGKGLAADDKAVHSLDDIPDFDNAEDEARYWAEHGIGSGVIDEIANVQVEEEG